ncbi:hypothetical protein LXL04_028477 [Taraxacum kok-saghyz]
MPVFLRYVMDNNSTIGLTTPPWDAKRNRFWFLPVCSSIGQKKQKRERKKTEDREREEEIAETERQRLIERHKERQRDRDTSRQETEGRWQQLALLLRVVNRGELKEVEIAQPQGEPEQVVYGQPQGEPRQRYDMGVYGQPHGEPKHQPLHYDVSIAIQVIDSHMFRQLESQKYHIQTISITTVLLLCVPSLNPFYYANRFGFQPTLHRHCKRFLHFFFLNTPSPMLQGAILALANGVTNKLHLQMPVSSRIIEPTGNLVMILKNESYRTQGSIPIDKTKIQWKNLLASDGVELAVPIGQHCTFELNNSSLKMFDLMPYPIHDFVSSSNNRLITEELAYDKITMKNEFQQLLSSLTVEQGFVFDDIMKVVHDKKGPHILFMGMVIPGKLSFGKLYPQE